MQKIYTKFSHHSLTVLLLYLRKCMDRDDVNFVVNCNLLTNNYFLLLANQSAIYDLICAWLKARSC